MRQHPIGTGPFKFVEFKPNEYIKVAQEPRLLEAGPALSRRHRVRHHPQPLDRDPRLYRRQVRHDLAVLRHPAAGARHRQEQAPQRDLRDRRPTTPPSTCCINRDKPPFDNADLRRALALTLDRKAFIDILAEGQGKIGGAMLPPPEGLWGMPPGDAGDDARLRPRRAKEPRRSARDHAKARLRSGQAARNSRSRRATSRPIATRR